MKVTGVKLIEEERARQIVKEGWTPEHDAEHTEGQIALAAAVYATPSEKLAFKPEGFFRGDGDFRIPELWPWDDAWYKPTNDRIRELTKAGALIAAEIDRLLKNKK